MAEWQSEIDDCPYLGMLFLFSSLLVALLTGKYTWTRAGVVFRSMKHPSTRSMLVRIFIMNALLFFPPTVAILRFLLCGAGINTCLWSADWRIMVGWYKKRRVCLWAAWWRTSCYSWRGLPTSVSMLSCRLLLVITCSYNRIVFVCCASFVYMLSIPFVIDAVGFLLIPVGWIRIWWTELSFGQMTSTDSIRYGVRYSYE